MACSLNGEAPMVLSYTTSPAYHIIAEKTDTLSRRGVREGHYMQVEVPARIADSPHGDLAGEVPCLHDRAGIPGRRSPPPTGCIR